LSEIIEVKKILRDIAEVLVGPLLQIVHIKLGVPSKSNGIPDILNRKFVKVGGESSMKSSHPKLNSANSVLVESDALGFRVLEVGFNTLGTLFFEDDFSRNFEGCSRYNWMLSIRSPSLVIQFGDFKEKVPVGVNRDNSQVLVMVRR
jgi:hypothetical protein